MLTDDRQPKSIGSRQPPAAATRSSAAAGPTCPVHRGAVAEAHLAVVAQPLLVSSTPCGLVNRVLSPVIAGIFRCVQPGTNVVGEEGNDQPSRLRPNRRGSYGTDRACKRGRTPGRLQSRRDGHAGHVVVRVAAMVVGGSPSS
jgi:hypothetical protein